MSRRLTITLALVLVAAATVAAVVATYGGASSDRLAFSTRGRQLAVQGLRIPQARVVSGRVLAVRGGRALYRFTLAGGDPCFGAGAARDLGTPGSLVCPHGGFPRAGEPVLDLSVYEGTRRGVREVALYRAEGFAADGVAAVAFFRPNGDVALKVPVSANVYSTTAVPMGPVWGLAALDADGKRIWHSP